MQRQTSRIAPLSIAASGALLAALGAGLFLTREFIRRRDPARFLSPRPPIRVAAYVFAVDFFDHFGNDTTTASRHALVETVTATGISAARFFVPSIGVILVVTVCDRLL